MKTIVYKLFAVLTFSLVGFSSHCQDVTGGWYGVAVFPHTTLRLTFHVVKDGDHYNLTGDSPDQYTYGFEIGGLSVESNKFTIRYEPFDIVYNGVISNDRKSIEGDFNQHGNTLTLKLTRDSNITPKDAITRADAVAINSLLQEFNEATKTNNLEALMETYDEYPLFMAPFGDDNPLYKKPDIQEVAKIQMEKKPASDASYTLLGLEISGNMAYATGNYKVVRDGETSKGRFLNVFKKYEDGSWKISVDIWNTMED